MNESGIEEEEEEEAIAEAKVVLVNSAGQKSRVTLAVGKPYYVDGTACCTYYMEGYKKPFRSYGEDTLQALCGALGMIRVHLNSLVKDAGYKIYEDDVDFEADNYEQDYSFSIEATFSTKL
jgi:hypothetical protein